MRVFDLAPRWLPLLALVFLFASSPATAQVDPAGSVGVYFDAAYTTSDLVDPTPFVPGTFYIVAKGISEYGLQAKVKGYEFGVELPAGMTVLGRTLNPATSLDLGTGEDNWVVGTGACITPTDDTYQMLSYSFMFLAAAPENLRVGVIGSTPSSFDPAVPGWLECDSDLVPYREIIPGRINPVGCDLAGATFDGSVVVGTDAGGGELFSFDTGKPVLGALVQDWNGDGDADLLYWTGSSAVEAGSFGVLDCQGSEVGSFTDAGLACAPTDGLVDVFSFELGEFDGDNPGDELLLFAADLDGQNDVPATRVTLLDKSFTVLGTNNDFQWWALGDFTTYFLEPDGGSYDIVLGGTVNDSGHAAIVRVGTGNLRGAWPAADGCLAGTEEASRRWEFDYTAANPANAEAYFQQESAVTALATDGSVVTVTMDSGNVYEVDANDYLPLPIDLADIVVSGGVVTGRDGAAQELWTLDTGAPDLRSATLFPADALSPTLVVLFTGDGGLWPNSIVTLEAHGKPGDLYAQPTPTCYGDEEAAILQDFQPFTVVSEGGTTYEGRGFLMNFRYPTSSNTALRIPVVQTPVRITEPSAYDFPGPVDVLLQDLATSWLYLGGTNLMAGGYAHVLGFDLTDSSGLAGSAPPASVGCDPGSELWSALFDGSGDYPLDVGAVTALALGEGVLDVTTAGEAYQLDAATGALLGGCDLTSATFEGGIVTALDGEGGTLFTYDAGDAEGFNVRAVEVRTDLGADPTIVGVATASAPFRVNLFRVDCEGVELYHQPVMAVSCLHDPSLWIAISFSFSDGAFTAAGATERWFHISLTSAGAEAEDQIVVIDLVDGLAESTYTNWGPVELALIPGEPARFALVGRNYLLDAGIATVVPAGVSGVSDPGCTVPVGKRDGELWYRVYDGSLPTLPAVASFVDPVVDGEEFRFDAEDGSGTFRVQLADGAAVPCGLASVEIAAAEVVFLDGGGSELFRRNMGVPVSGAALLDWGDGGDPEVVVSTTDAQLHMLTCAGEGQTVWSNDTRAGWVECFGDLPNDFAVTGLWAPFVAGPGADESILALTTGESAPGEFFYGTTKWSPQGVSQGSFWHEGRLVDDLMGDFDGDGVQDLLLLGQTQTDPSVADLLLLSTDNLYGVDPTHEGDCPTDAPLWALRWDGSDPNLPIETEPVSVEQVAPDRVEVLMASGHRYLVRLDGTLLTDVELALGEAGPVAPGAEFTLSLTGSLLTGLAGADGTILYDPDLLDFVGGALGQLLLDAGEFTGVFNGDVAGEIGFAFARATGLEADAGELLVLTFRVDEAAQPGLTPVSFGGLNLFNELSEPLGVNALDGVVEIGCEKFDVTGDGEVHSNDAILTLRIDVGLHEPTAYELCAADIDEDGEVTAGDAVMILRYVVGLPVVDVAPADMGVATLTIDGLIERLEDGRLAVPVLLETSGILAGADLSLVVDEGVRLSGVRFTDGLTEGLLLSRVEGRTLHLAAASAEGLALDGRVRLQLLLTPERESGSVELEVREGLAFGADGTRAEVASGSTLSFALEETPPVKPTANRLLQNVPNPFNPRTDIRFHLAEAGHVRLTVYDVSGRRIATLVDGPWPAGEHGVPWLGQDDAGKAVASGVYLYRIEAPGFSESKRMILVR